MPTEIQKLLQAREKHLGRPETFDELRVTLLAQAELHLREGRRPEAAEARAAYRALMHGTPLDKIVWKE